MFKELAAAGNWDELLKQLQLPKVKGAKPFEPKDLNDALLIAAAAGHQESVGRLLTAGAAIDICDENRFTVMHFAIRAENLRMIEYLGNVELCERSKLQVTAPARLFSSQGMFVSSINFVFQRLLNNESSWVVMNAVLSAFAQIFRNVYQRYDLPDFYDVDRNILSSVLKHIILTDLVDDSMQSCGLSLIRFSKFLEFINYPDSKDNPDKWTFLDYALKKERWAFVKELNCLGATCSLSSPSFEEHKTKLADYRKKLEQDAELRKKNTSTLKNLFWQFRIGSAKQVIDFLQDNDVDINSIDFLNSNRSFLHYAVAFTDVALVTALLLKGISTGHRDFNRRTALSSAFHSQSPEKRAMMIAIMKGSDTWYSYDSDIYPEILSWAVAENDEELVLIMLTSVKQWTDSLLKVLNTKQVLCWAINNNKQKIIEALIDKGLSLAAVNLEGDSAIKLAFKLGNSEIVEFLIQSSSKVFEASKSKPADIPFFEDLYLILSAEMPRSSASPSSIQQYILNILIEKVDSVVVKEFIMEYLIRRQLYQAVEELAVQYSNNQSGLSAASSFISNPFIKLVLDLPDDLLRVPLCQKMCANSALIGAFLVEILQRRDFPLFIEIIRNKHARNLDAVIQFMCNQSGSIGSIVAWLNQNQGHAIFETLFDIIGPDFFQHKDVPDAEKDVLRESLEQSGLLHSAVSRGKESLIISLLDLGLMPATVDEAGQTCVQIALHQQNWDLVRHFINHQMTRPVDPSNTIFSNFSNDLFRVLAAALRMGPDSPLAEIIERILTFVSDFSESCFNSFCTSIRNDFFNGLPDHSDIQALVAIAYQCVQLLPRTSANFHALINLVINLVMNFQREFIDDIFAEMTQQENPQLRNPMLVGMLMGMLEYSQGDWFTEILAKADQSHLDQLNHLMHEKHECSVLSYVKRIKPEIADSVLQSLIFRVSDAVLIDWARSDLEHFTQIVMSAKFLDREFRVNMFVRIAVAYAQYSDDGAVIKQLICAIHNQADRDAITRICEAMLAEPLLVDWALIILCDKKHGSYQRVKQYLEKFPEHRLSSFNEKVRIVTGEPSFLHWIVSWINDSDALDTVKIFIKRIGYTDTGIIPECSMENRNGKTPIQCAQSKECWAAVAFLFSLSPNKKDVECWTPRGSTRSLKLESRWVNRLLLFGAEVNPALLGSGPNSNCIFYRIYNYLVTYLQKYEKPSAPPKDKGSVGSPFDRLARDTDFQLRINDFVFLLLNVDRSTGAINEDYTPVRFRFFGQTRYEVLRKELLALLNENRVQLFRSFLQDLSQLDSPLKVFFDSVIASGNVNPMPVAAGGNLFYRAYQDLLGTSKADEFEAKKKTFIALLKRIDRVSGVVFLFDKWEMTFLAPDQSVESSSFVFFARQNEKSEQRLRYFNEFKGWIGAQLIDGNEGDFFHEIAGACSDSRDSISLSRSTIAEGAADDSDDDDDDDYSKEGLRSQGSAPD